MNGNYYFDPKMIGKLLMVKYQNEILAYISDSMAEAYDEAPDARTIKDYLTSGKADDSLLTSDQKNFIDDKLFEYAMGSLHAIDEMVHYKRMKEEGLVANMDEYMAFRFPDEEEG